MRHAFALTLAFLISTFGVISQAEPAAPVTPFTPYETPQQRVPVGPGRFINVVCMGQGSPTVILSAGGDGWSIDWIRVQYAISRTTRVCAWDRAGHGFSSGSPEPQDILHTEGDLERALAGAGLTGPLVMVAHSLGAFEALIFADRHPDRVAGMVMVDPSTPDQEERLDHAAPALRAYNAQSTAPFFDSIRRCIAALKRGAQGAPVDCAKLRPPYPEPLRSNLIAVTNDPSYWEAFLSVFDCLKLDSKQAINPKRNYGALPIVVLRAGLFDASGAPPNVQQEVPAFRALGMADQDAMAQLSTRGTLVTVPDSPHWIAGRKPSVVIDTVDKVLEQGRQR